MEGLRTFKTFPKNQGYQKAQGSLKLPPALGFWRTLKTLKKIAADSLCPLQIDPSVTTLWAPRPSLFNLRIVYLWAGCNNPCTNDTSHKFSEIGEESENWNCMLIDKPVYGKILKSGIKTLNFIFCVSLPDNVQCKSSVLIIWAILIWGESNMPWSETNLSNSRCSCRSSAIVKHELAGLACIKFNHINSFV